MPETQPLRDSDPKRLGSYEIIGRLGMGEQGTVFLGRGPAGHDVAVKLLHMRFSCEPEARARFTAAFAPAREVIGWCTAAILEAEVDNDRAYVVTEYVDGPSLRQLVDDEGPRGNAVVEHLAVGIAVALAAAHQVGWAHHDLKPGNVLLGRDGPRVCDFGVVRALDGANPDPTGHTTGDPSYKAPEQLSTSEQSSVGVGPAADIFAWAATTLFAASGTAPFGDGTPSEVTHRIVHDDPDLSVLPESLRQVIEDALATDPAERPSAKDVLGRLLTGDDGLASRLPPPVLSHGLALASGPTPASTTHATDPTPHPIPGLESLRNLESLHNGERRSTSILNIPELGGDGFRQVGTHLRGAALPLISGVAVGIVIIMLVLTLRDGGDPGPPPLGATSTGQPVNAIPEAFAGTWRGTAVNAVNNANFPIEVTFQAGTTTATAQYPKGNCDGTLKFIRGTGTELEMALTITPPCTNGNVQISRQSDGTLQYAWSTPQNRRKYTAKLSRS